MKIELPKDIIELGHLQCISPICVDVYYVDRKLKIAYFEWDFGMDSRVFLDHPLLDWKNKKIKDKIIVKCQYDLAHSFCHYNKDPNYEYYHWALYGNLKDRIKIIEDEEIL